MKLGPGYNGAFVDLIKNVEFYLENFGGKEGKRTEL